MIKFIIKILNKYKIYVKFIFAGGLATITHFTILITLTEVFNVHYLLSASIGFMISFLVSFSLQKFWTFRDNDRDRLPKQILMYFITSLTGLAVNTGLMYVLVEWAEIYYIIAQIITGAAIAVGNFIVYRLIIFKKSQTDYSDQISSKDTQSLKRRLLIATPIFPPVIGGPATYVETLREELPKHGFEVRVVTYGNVKEITNYKIKIPNKSQISNSNNETEIISIPRKKSLLIKYWLFFWTMFKEVDNSDIVYIMDPINAGLPAALASFLRAKDYFIKIVGDYAWEHAQECHGVSDHLDDFQKRKYNKKIELIRALQKRVVKGARSVIAPSNYLKELVSGWGIGQNKIKVIYNAVKEANINIIQARAKEDLGLKGDIAITIGRLVPWKGFDVLIDITAEIVKFRPRYKLVIVGEGPQQRHIVEKIKNCPAQDYIRFIPGLEQKKLWEYMRASDVFILNTDYEGLSHIVIEAQMLELPVITTPAGGNREVVIDNENGILVGYNKKEEIKAALIDLLSDKEKGLKLARNAHDGLAKFSQKKMIAGVVKVLRSK